MVDDRLTTEKPEGGGGDRGGIFFFAVSSSGEDGQLGAFAGLVEVGYPREVAWAQDEGVDCRAVAIERDGLSAPIGNSDIDRDDQERRRAIEADAHPGQVRQPAPALLCIAVELDLDDDRALGWSSAVSSLTTTSARYSAGSRSRSSAEVIRGVVLAGISAPVWRRSSGARAGHSRNKSTRDS